MTEEPLDDPVELASGLAWLGSNSGPFILAERGVPASMNRRRNCYDNAPSDNSASSFKTEWLSSGSFASKDQARATISEYIEVFYNRRRRYSTLDGVSRARYEARRREQAA